MKIVFLARYLPTEGSTTHMYAVAQNLIEKGNEVYILSRGTGKDEGAKDLYKKAKKTGVQFVKIPFPLYNTINLFTRIQQLLSYIYAMPFALYHLFRIKPDVVHAHYPVTTYIASIYRFFTGKKYIVTHHIMGIPQHMLNRKADYVIAISRELQAFLISDYNYDNDKVKLIFNGVPVIANPNESISNIELRTKYNIPEEKIVFGFVGSVSHRKGIDVLVKAIERCKDLNIHLVILGDGKIEWLKQLLSENNINHMVTLVPFRDPQEIYSLMDVLILPSRQEGFPLVPLEAMMMKTPVLRSNIDGSKDQILEGVNGYTFESENDLQLADLIKKITLKPEVLPEFGENAYKHAIANFSEGLMVDKMLDVYKLTL